MSCLQDKQKGIVHCISLFKVYKSITKNVNCFDNRLMELVAAREKDPRKTRRRKNSGGSPRLCVFCRNNGETEAVYTSHNLKVCPRFDFFHLIYLTMTLRQVFSNMHCYQVILFCCNFYCHDKYILGLMFSWFCILYGDALIFWWHVLVLFMANDCN